MGNFSERGHGKPWVLGRWRGVCPQTQPHYAPSEVCIKLVTVAPALAALVSIVVTLIRTGSHSDPTAATAALAGVSMLT